ncbi:MAG: sulfite oxidase-like oxidoreductase [Planctomycetota bacterium]|nr:sulfite oxidase-like oxidoreductase [Planctomycetota bacterium]
MDNYSPNTDDKYQHGDAPEGKNLADDVIISPDTQRINRLPPNQVRTRKWPVLDASGAPEIPRDWQLKIFGLVKNPFTLNLDEFQAEPRVQVFADFHCVTQWSRLGNLWEGVSANYLLQRAGVLPEARYVILHGYDNHWTTNLPLEDFLQVDVLLADLHDGQPIDVDHGGPVRAIVPQLYAWKSAKWICGIELLAENQPGYWEQGGYHNHGDPWKEERWGG